LSGLLAFGSGAAAMAAGLAPLRATASGARFAFTPIAAQTDQTVHVPEGYDWRVLVRWGDPLFSDAPAFDHATGGEADTADRVFGENTDGMESFVVDGRQLIAVNHRRCAQAAKIAGRHGDGTARGGCGLAGRDRQPL
jgi:secreted PhoX family phosphatase